MNILFIIGAILAGIAILGIGFIFVYIASKLETNFKNKKLPRWLIILMVFLFIIGLGSIPLIIIGGITM